jgi:hypothetical protein
VPSRGKSPNHFAKKFLHSGSRQIDFVLQSVNLSEQSWVDDDMRLFRRIIDQALSAEKKAFRRGAKHFIRPDVVSQLCDRAVQRGEAPAF